MIRAVLDTNIVVSAMLSAGGPSARIVKAGIAGHFQWLVSDALLAECEEVLLRPDFELNAREVRDVIEPIRATALFVTPKERVSLAKDPDDNKVIECAIEGKAAYLVTGNLRHFPDSVRGCRAISPRNFLTILSAGLS